MCSLYSSVCIKYHKIKSKVSSVEEGQEASRRDTGYLGLDRRRGGEKGLQSWIKQLGIWRNSAEPSVARSQCVGLNGRSPSQADKLQPD